MNIAELIYRLDSVYKTLQIVHVCGDDNMDHMLGSMRELKNIINALMNPPKQEDNAPENTAPAQDNDRGD